MYGSIFLNKHEQLVCLEETGKHIIEKQQKLGENRGEKENFFLCFLITFLYRVPNSLTLAIHFLFVLRNISITFQ